MAKKFMDPYSKLDVSAFVRMKLKTSPQWAMRACVVIFEQQTAEERVKAIPVAGRNGVGFDLFDSPLLTRIAKRIRTNTHMEEDVSMLYHVMSKYAEQVIKLSDKAALFKHVDAYYRRKGDRLPF